MHLALLGENIDHSWSPELQAAALDAAGFEDSTYEIVDISAEELERSWSEIGSEFDGANVTVPHKELVRGLVDELDEEARATGAVNTVLFLEHGTIGANTDVVGVRRALERMGGFASGRVLILGAGGSARAVLRALESSPDVEVVLAARTRSRAETVAESTGCAVRSCEWSARTEELSHVDLVINTTPLGRDSAPWPIDPASVGPKQRVFDLNYGVGGSAWTGALRAAGCELVRSGETMLLEQGAAAFELWTGRTADRRAMREAIAPLYLEGLGE